MAEFKGRALESAEAWVSRLGHLRPAIKPENLEVDLKADNSDEKSDAKHSQDRASPQVIKMFPKVSRRLFKEISIRNQKAGFHGKNSMTGDDKVSIVRRFATPLCHSINTDQSLDLG